MPGRHDITRPAGVAFAVVASMDSVAHHRCKIRYAGRVRARLFYWISLASLPSSFRYAVFFLCC